jgi:hypothetical protein
MPVNTKKVVGRRELRYESYADLLDDAERLAAIPCRTLGNWTLGQILLHTAQAIDSSIDGAGFVLPAPLRWAMTLLMKRRFLNRSLPAGFKTSPQFIPDDTSVEEGLAALRHAIQRQATTTKRAAHPAFGRISQEEWDDFNLRHAEMHMSFVVPA